MAIPIISDLFGVVSGWFADAAGWAVDSVIAAVTTWVLAGVISLIEAIWGFIDVSSDPVLDAAWFSGDGSSPFAAAMAIGSVMMAVTVLAAVIRAVLAGSVGGIAKAVGHDLPAAVLLSVATIGFTAVGLDATNAMSEWVWQATRDDAMRGLDNVAAVIRSGVPGGGFLAVAVGVLMLAAMLFLWVVLFVREALIYVVIVFSVAFAWPLMVFPPLRDTAKKSGELLLALIVCTPVIVLAMSIGVSALAAVGDEGNGLSEFTRMIGTLMVGVIVFGMAAFMPFLVWKLMPIVAAAVVAQGVASGPSRAVQQGMQMQFYGRQLTSGGRIHGTHRATIVSPHRPPGSGAGAAPAGTPAATAAAAPTSARTVGGGAAARMATSPVRSRADRAVDATAGTS